MIEQGQGQAVNVFREQITDAEEHEAVMALHCRLLPLAGKRVLPVLSSQHHKWDGSSQAEGCSLCVPPG